MATQRPTDPNTRNFVDILAIHGLVNCVSVVTHNRGGSLDVVAVRSDLPQPVVSVLDVGLSDHRLLTWSASLTRLCPIYTSATSRPWRNFDATSFRAALRSSQLCRRDSWHELSIDDLARLYDKEITNIFDVLLPSRIVLRRRRTSDPWFDEECRVEKRTVRQLERAARRAGSSDTSAAATAAWMARRRSYRELLRRKRESFWQSKVEAERSSPRQLWRSIDALMGRGRAPMSAAVGAVDIHRFFDDKVAGVRTDSIVVNIDSIV